MAKKEDINVTENEAVKDDVNQAEAVQECPPEENQTDENQAEESQNEQDTEEGDVTEKEETQKDEKDILIEELTDKYKRTFAEFDNFRKRSEKERAAMFEVGAKSIVEKILPIVDSFERGLATLSDEEKESPFADGMDKVYKQMVKALEEAGVTPIDAVGKEFDPNFHNAVMHGEDENLGENIIAEEFQKGYMYRDTVVRYSMVKVVN